MKNPLSEYNKKRDFSQTSEPEGKLKISKNLRFVIQKHEASHLHYDFRIEHKGVLKSWAVPKGLPYESKQRRLAMHVEDHPVSYFDFEGVIPEGNYGAGEVIVWDMGNYWVPHAENAKEVESKIEEGFKKGEIKLVLNGEKVNGLFALVRFEKAGEKAWLFIKDRDEYEGKNFMKDERSVKTGKKIEELKTPAKKTSGFEFIPPMLATLGDSIFDDSNYIYEEKFDGYRIIAVLENGEVNLYSRNGENMNRKFPKIAKALEGYKINCIIDGEVTAYDKDQKASFQLLQNAAQADQLVYHVFDILNLNGISTLELPLIERKKFLKKAIKTKKNVQLADYVKKDGKTLFKRLSKSAEGVIAKKANSKYFPGERTSDWIKFKHQLRDEFVIGGVTHPQGKRSGFGSLIVGQYKKDKLIYVGHIGTGFTDKLIEKLYSTFEKIKIDHSPFDNYDGDRSVQFWVEPVIVCEATFAQWTDDNMIRQASFVGIRTDKFPNQVNNEDKKTEVSDVISNILTNPNKVFFPEKKYTKLDLAKYYTEIAPIILPYLKDRPQNLNRHPNGIHGVNFYQKDIEFDLPEFAHKISIARDKLKKDNEGKMDRSISYLLCQNVETLIYMVNLGCIEINPWLSRIESLDKPDYLVFDIDPNKVDFVDVVKTVRNIYEFLEEVGIHSIIKTSGKRGLHLYAYLGGKYSYEESRGFAELIAQIFQQRYPDLISLERSPDDRKGKIYIDYLQNRQGQTTASVYSARPTVNATVSTPLKPSELNARLDPTKFDIKNTLKRIEKHGDLWAELMKKPVDLPSALSYIKKTINY